MAHYAMQKRKREDAESGIRYDVLIHEDGRRQYTRPDGWFWTEYADKGFQLKSLPAGKYYFGDATACPEVIDDLAGYDGSICAARVNADGTRSVCAVLSLYRTRTYTVRVDNEPVSFYTNKLVFVSEDLTSEECKLFTSPVHVYMNEEKGIFGIKSGEQTITFPA